MDNRLSRFVREALGQGTGKQEIRNALLDAGWPEDEVRDALDSFANVRFGIPIPRPRPYLPAREAFLYLVVFTMLYLSAWSLGALLFALVEQALPDPGWHARWAAEMSRIRWAIATLLIAFPGYLLLSRRSYLATRRDPEKRRSKVRKWLTYLTLFLAAATLLGDLISLVSNLLEGETTARFLLKVLVVGGIAGSVLGYYLWDLRQDDLDPSAPRGRQLGLRLFAAAVTLIVATSIGAGLVLSGSPHQARQLRIDQQRVNRLQQIAREIDVYWGEFQALPADLEMLERTRDFVIRPRDPLTGLPFEYTVIGARSYELCAVFDGPSAGRDEHVQTLRTPSRDGSGFWRHGAGRTCYRIEARADTPPP